MSNLLKVLGAVFLVFIVIAVIAGIFGGSDAENAAESPAVNALPAKPQIEIISQNVTNSQFGGQNVVAEVKNNTNKTASYVELKAVFIDAENHIVGTGMGNTLELLAGQTKTIEILTMDNITAAKTYRVEVATVLW